MDGFETITSFVRIFRASGTNLWVAAFSPGVGVHSQLGGATAF